MMPLPPLVGALGFGVVAGADPQHTGGDDDLPPRPLDDLRVPSARLRHGRQQIRGRTNQLRPGEPRAPQLLNRVRLLVVIADRYGTWDKPRSTGQAGR